MIMLTGWIMRNPVTTLLLGIVLTLGVVLGFSRAANKGLKLRNQTLTRSLEAADKLLEGQRIITGAKAKQAEIAWSEVERLRKKGQERKVVIQTGNIPSDCPGAVQWGVESVNSLTEGWR